MRFLALLSLLACRTDKPNDIIEEETIVEDNDGDTFTVSDGDCDDENASVYPNAEEVWSIIKLIVFSGA